MKSITVRVTELQIGDKLVTGVVTHSPYDSIDCPRGKINVGINGYRKTWNKSTTIRVDRDARS